MGLNRLIDAELDARNPRTATREHPVRARSRATQVSGLCGAALAVYLVAVFQLDPVVRWLWPIPVALFVVYPYLKRVTWLCHLWLGACTGLAPVGRVDRGHGLGAVGGVGAVCRRRASGWPGSTSSTRSSTSSTIGGGAALVGDALGRARRLRGRASASMLDRRRSSPRSVSGLPLGRLLLARRRRRRGAAPLRAPDRPPGRPAPARRGVLHRQRRHQHRLLRVRPDRHAVVSGAARGRAAARRRPSRAGGRGSPLPCRQVTGRPGSDASGSGGAVDHGGRRREALRPQAGAARRLVRGPRGGFLVVTGRTAPARRRSCGSSRGLRRRPGDAERRRRPLPARLSRARAARLSRAHRAREPRPLRPALPRARAPRADRDAARALRAVGRARAIGSPRTRAG